MDYAFRQASVHPQVLRAWPRQPHTPSGIRAYAWNPEPRPARQLGDGTLAEAGVERDGVAGGRDGGESWRSAVRDKTAQGAGRPVWLNVPSEVAQVVAERREHGLATGAHIAAVCPGMVDTVTSPLVQHRDLPLVQPRPPAPCSTSSSPSASTPPTTADWSASGGS